MLLDGPTQSTRIPNSGAMQAQGYIVVHLLIIYCQFGAILALPKVHKSLIQEPCQHKGILPCNCHFVAILALPKVPGSLIQEPCKQRAFFPCIYIYICSTLGPEPLIHGPLISQCWQKAS